MGDNPSPEEAVSFFNSCGVDGEALKESINNQHSSCAENEKRDFAHECAIYSVMANSNTTKSIAGKFDDVNALVGYKGDVYSGKMDIDDKKSDISAYNIYNRMLNSKDGDIWNTMVEYNENASDGTINESKEFLERLGNGDAEKGMKKLKKQLNKTSIGTDIISKDVDEEKIKETKDDFLKHVSNESGVDIG